MHEHDGADRSSELLIVVCGEDGADRLCTADAGTLADRTVRERFLGLAARHGVLGLVLQTVERSACQRALPADVQQQLGRMLRQLRVRATVLQLERDHILATLREHDVRAVVLKGAGLASTVFTNPVEREFGDIDLLVPPAQIDAALDALGGRGYKHPNSFAAIEGYRQHHFHIRIRRPGGTIVELHWGLTRHLEPFRLNAAAFLERSVLLEQPRAGASTATETPPPLCLPCAEHALLHMVVECARGDFSRIKWLVDVDRIVASVPSMDWTYVVESAREGHLLPSLSLALEMSRQLLGTRVPDAVLRQVRPSRATRLHLALLRPSELVMRQRTLARVSSADLLRMWLLSGRSRAAWLMTQLTPAADDPLQWMWDDPDVPRVVRSTFAYRAARVGKLLADQFGTYAVGARALFTRGGREAMQVW